MHIHYQQFESLRKTNQIFLFKHHKFIIVFLINVQIMLVLLSRNFKCEPLSVQLRRSKVYSQNIWMSEKSSVLRWMDTPIKVISTVLVEESFHSCGIITKKGRKSTRRNRPCPSVGTWNIYHHWYETGVRLYQQDSGNMSH